MDLAKIIKYIHDLVHIPSPTGFTNDIRHYLAKNAKKKNIKYEITKKGAVIYKFETEKSQKSAMLCSHVDTLGAIVSKVEKDFVRISPIGGYPPLYIIGNYCTIHTYNGETYSGTILPDNPSCHVNTKLKDTKLDFSNIHIRVDIKLKDKDDTLKNYIQNGNYISFDPHFSQSNCYIKSRHLDDKACSAILLSFSDFLSDNIEKLCNNIYIYFNTTEETGQGVSALPELDEVIIIDMGCVGEGLEGDEYSVSICPKDSAGIYDYNLTQSLINLAKEHHISYKIDIYPSYGSDGSMILRSGEDLKVALIGPGVGASHGYERLHEESLSNTLKLIMKYSHDFLCE